MKYHPHDGVLFVTLSIEEGLLLLCNPLCKLIIQSCLARAQHLYPVKISHLLVEGTHIHLILVVDNPADVSSFIRHFKTESAHLLNGVLGRKKRTVWCEGYDSPIVLTPIRALLAIIYLYSNPTKDNLEDSIEGYPGYSTWKMFRTGAHKRICKRISRTAVRYLSRDAHSYEGYRREAERLLAIKGEEHEFVLQPNAWMEAFGINDPAEQSRINERIRARLQTVEERYRKLRARSGKKPLGRNRLLRQVFDLFYRSDRRGRRTFCLTENKKLRLEFISFFRDLMEQAREISRCWKAGDFSQPYPLGLYPPSMPKLAEPISIW